MAAAPSGEARRARCAGVVSWAVSAAMAIPALQAAAGQADLSAVSPTGSRTAGHAIPRAHEWWTGPTADRAWPGAGSIGLMTWRRGSSPLDFIAPGAMRSSVRLGSEVLARADELDRAAAQRNWIALSAMRDAAGEPSFPALPGEEDAQGPPVNYRGEEVFAAQSRYFEDFEGSDIGREWAALGAVTEMDEFGRFAGPFRNSSQTINLRVEPGESYMIVLDLYFIAASLGDPDASDNFRIIVDGQVLYENAFQVLLAANKEDNGEDPDFNSAIFRGVTVPFVAQNTIVEITISSSAAGLPGGETWGFDNFLVDTALSPTMGGFEPDAGESPIWGGGGTADVETRHGSDDPNGGRLGRAKGGGGGGGGGGGFDPRPPETDDPDDPDDPDRPDRPDRPPRPPRDPRDPPADDPPDEPPLDPPGDDPPPNDDPPVPSPGALSVLLVAGAAGAVRRRRAR